MNLAKPTVAHFVNSYLPLTGSWIYNQIRHLVRWRPVVLSFEVENLDIFPFASIYTRQSLSKPAQIYRGIMRRTRGHAPFF